MSTPVRGIIWKITPRQESDALLTIYTREHGKMEYIAKGLRGEKSRRRGTLQPFSMIEFDHTEPRLPHQSAIITHSTFLFAPVLTDPLAFAELGLAAEISAHFLPWQETAPGVFRLWEEFLHIPFQKPLRELCGFLVHLSTELGLFPDVRTCRLCGEVFSPESRIIWESGTGLSCCAESMIPDAEQSPLSFSQLKSLFFFRSVSPAQFHKLALRDEEALAIFELLFRQLRWDDSRSFPARQVFERMLRA